MKNVCVLVIALLTAVVPSVLGQDTLVDTSTATIGANLDSETLSRLPLERGLQQIVGAPDEQLIFFAGAEGKQPS